MAGVAVFAAQHLPVHTQAHANAGAPGHVSAVGQGLTLVLQCAPAALGFQRGNAVVRHPHAFEHRAQGGLQQGGGPVVGQAARLARHAAANIGRGQFDHAVVQDKWAAGRDAHRSQVRHIHACGRTALPHQADDLQRQGVVCALFGGGLGHATAHPLRIGNADCHLGAANVNTGHGRGTLGQAKFGNVLVHGFFR